MELLISLILYSLKTSNWFSALFLTLSIPDICSSIESANRKTTPQKYKNWFNKYLKEKYSQKIGCPDEMLSDLPESVTKKFKEMSNLNFTAEDCYALRCSLFHQGTTSVSHQQKRIHNVVDNFVFVIPQKSGSIHFNLQENNNHKVMQFQIDIFCNDFVSAYRSWFNEQNQRTKKMCLNDMSSTHFLRQLFYSFV